VTSIDQEWTNLLTFDDASLEPVIRDRMVAINQQTEDQRVAALANILRSEAELAPPELRRLTGARFRAWLTMPAEEVQAFSSSLDQARGLTPGTAALRSTGADQTAAQDLSADDCLRLLELAPSFERALPTEMREVIETTARRERGEPQAAEQAAAGRPFWKFWQR